MIFFMLLLQGVLVEEELIKTMFLLLQVDREYQVKEILVVRVLCPAGRLGQEVEVEELVESDKMVAL